MIKKKIKVLVMLPILSILLLLGFTTVSIAAQFEEGDYKLEESQIVEENLYITGENVEIAGVVDGDLFAGANTITITGTVTGDLYAFASRVELSGNIYGSAFLIGQSVDVSGSVARNLYTASMFSDLTGSVGKDATIFANNSMIAGKVTEDARVFGNRSVITGRVKGEALIYSTSSTVDEDLVEGDLYENIEVQREDSKEEITIPKRTRERIGNAFLGVNLFSTVTGFVAMYIVGVVLIYLAPVKTLQIEQKVTGSLQEFLFSFLIGLGIAVFVPLPLLILAFTLIGAPLAILIASILFFMAIWGTIWVESAIGQKILSSADKKDPKRLLSLLIGRGLTSVVRLIPIVRGLYKSVLSLTAIGAVVRMKYDAYKGKKKKATKK